jgi:DNA-binding NtrC family response regulator
VGTPKVVWIVDSDQWPRALLRAELIGRGFDAVGYLTVEDALATFPRRFPDLIVIDLRDQPREDVEKLFQIGVPVIAVAGALDAVDQPFTAVMRRPVSLGEIADKVAATLDPR